MGSVLAAELITGDVDLKKHLPAFCTVRLLIFSFYLLFSGSQPTLFEGREDLHNFFNYLCRYGQMDIYFILWVIVQYHRQFILLYFTFLNFILLLHPGLCGVWYSMCHLSFEPVPHPHVYTLILQIRRFSFAAVVSSQGHFYCQVLMYVLWKGKS